MNQTQRLVCATTHWKKPFQIIVKRLVRDSHFNCAAATELLKTGMCLSIATVSFGKCFGGDEQPPWNVLVLDVDALFCFFLSMLLSAGGSPPVLPTLAPSASTHRSHPRPSTSRKSRMALLHTKKAPVGLVHEDTLLQSMTKPSLSLHSATLNTLDSDHGSVDDSKGWSPPTRNRRYLKNRRGCGSATLGLNLALDGHAFSCPCTLVSVKRESPVSESTSQECRGRFCPQRYSAPLTPRA